MASGRVATLAVCSLLTAASAQGSASPTAEPTLVRDECRVGKSPNTPATTCLDAFKACETEEEVVWLSGSATTGPYQAYCGPEGWALAMRIDGGATTFTYTSPYWTSNVLYNDVVEDVWDVSEAKLQTYVSLPLQQIRVVMRDENGVPGSSPVDITLNRTYPSLQAVFSNGDGALPTSIDRSSWLAVLPPGSPAINGNGCGRQGINVRNGRQAEKKKSVVSTLLLVSFCAS